jgi:hypothetical protein
LIWRKPHAAALATTFSYANYLCRWYRRFLPMLRRRSPRNSASLLVVFISLFHFRLD